MSEVTSVNGKTGAVVLDAADVEAIAGSSAGVAGGVATLGGAGKLPEEQLPSSVVSISTIGAARGIFSPKDGAYGAVGDGVEEEGAAMTAGSNILTMSGAPFTAENIREKGGGFKYVWVRGAGAAGAPLVARIESQINATEVRLAANAETTVSNSLAVFGSDDTGPLENLFAAMSANRANAVMQPPPGRYMYLTGVGSTLFSPRIVADSSEKGLTFILGNGVSLVGSPIVGGVPVALTAMHLENLRTLGGYGMVRHTYTGPNSGVTDFKCLNFSVEYFTGAGISSLTNDTPYWKIIGHMVNKNAGIGVALNGPPDDSIIEVDNFGLRVGAKIGYGGDSVMIRNSSWVGLTHEGFPLIPIWIVPKAEEENSGRQLVIMSYRFGNEGYTSEDHRLLYADEDATTGADFSSRMPKWTASTGYISGHWMGGGTEASGAGSTPCGPMVYSTTPNVEGCSWDVIMEQTLPENFLQFLTPPSPSPRNRNNHIRVQRRNSYPPASTLKPSNGIGVAYVEDPDGLFARQSSQPVSRPGGSSAAGFSLVLGATPSNLVGSATKTAATDSLGGTDAWNVTLTSGTDALNASITAAKFRIGVPLWVEFDLKEGESESLSEIKVELRYASAGTTHYYEYFPLTSEWVTHRVLVWVRAASENIQLGFYAKTPSSGKMRVGRVRMYHAREPVSFEDKLFIDQATSALSLLNVKNGVPILSNEESGTIWTPPVVTGQQRNIQPAAYGLLGWSGAPDTFTTTAQLAASGHVNLMYIPTPTASEVEPLLISNIDLLFSVVGGGYESGKNFVALFNPSGERLGVSADMSATMEGATAKVLRPCALEHAASVVTSGVYAAVLINASTRPTFFTTSAVAVFNAGLKRFGTVLSGQTAMPGSVALSSFAETTGIYLGVS